MPAYFAYKNHVTTPGLLVGTAIAGAVASSSVDAARPLSNIIDPDPSKVGRVNFVGGGGASYVYVTLDFATGTGQHIAPNLYAFLNVRLPPAITGVNVRLYNHDLTALQNLFAFNPTYFVPLPGTTDRYNLFVPLSTAIPNVGGAMLLIEFAAGLADYLEIGHFWVGNALMLEDGVAGDWKLGTIDPSEVERARGGALVANKLPVRRRTTMNIDAKTYALALGSPTSPLAASFRQFMQEAGRSTPVIVLPRAPSNTVTPSTEEIHSLQTLGLYASVTNATEIGHAGGNIYRASLDLEEIR